MLPGLDGAGHDISVTSKYVIAEGSVDQFCIVNVVAFKYFN